MKKNLLDHRTESNRDAMCLMRRFRKDQDVTMNRSSSGRWNPRDVIKCGRMTCPYCGTHRARHVSSHLAVAIQKHMRSDPYADAWMLTMTNPHQAESVKISAERLYEAAETFFRTPAWRRFAKRFDVVGKVRVLDAVHGGRNGSHLHFHVALFPKYAPFVVTPELALPLAESKTRTKWKRETEAVDEDFVNRFVAYVLNTPEPVESPIGLPLPLRGHDRETRSAWLAELCRTELLPAWEKSCERAGIVIRHRTAFRENALELTPSENAASYFVKWGLAEEVGAPTSKARSHLRLLDLVAAGYDVAGDIYRAFREAVHGRSWVTGLKDLCDRLEITDDDANEYVAEMIRRRKKLMADAGTPLPEVRELEVMIRSAYFPTAMRLGWTEVFRFCDDIDARDGDVQAELDRWLWGNLAPTDATGPPAET